MASILGLDGSTAMLDRPASFGADARATSERADLDRVDRAADDRHRPSLLVVRAVRP